jgi:predicted ATPase
MTAEQQVVLEVLQFLRTHKRYPTQEEIRSLASKNSVLGELLEDDSLWEVTHHQGERVQLTPEGFLKYGAGEATAQIERFLRILLALEQALPHHPDKAWSPEELSTLTGEPPFEVSLTLTLFTPHLHPKHIEYAEPDSDLVSSIAFDSQDFEPRRIAAYYLKLNETEGLSAPTRLSELRVSGYRVLNQLEAELEPLTVIIGANGSGKSSLFDLLSFISFAAVNPLPPEIDPRSVGKALFHLGGPHSIVLGLQVLRGTARPLRYAVEINGPIGNPRVAEEQLASFYISSDEEWWYAFNFLDFKEGKGQVRSVSHLSRNFPSPQPWKLPPNELALRRALDPTLVTLNQFREYVASWKFYTGFDVRSSAAIRRPVFTEPDPILKEDGSNLSAVLFHLMTEHQEAWSELETHLRSAIPAFQSLNVKSRGGPGTVMAVWREEAVKGELTLADLSDGTLKFLCWATLCLSPRKPPLICIDEPEFGLHPRVLPVLAGLLRQASSETQLIVSTHSPYFLSQFSLEEIAVMKKEDGHAVFARPATNEALRREIEELGTGELARLHINDELEVRS